MTPNERLLKAAKMVVGGRVDTVEDVAILRTEICELKAAVKECEAAPTHDSGGYVRFTPLTEGEPGGFDAELLSSDRPALTDEQRRMGLRSLRHMGPDYGSYDYD